MVLSSMHVAVLHLPAKNVLADNFSHYADVQGTSSVVVELGLSIGMGVGVGGGDGDCDCS